MDDNVEGLTEADLEAEIERVQRELADAQATEARNKVAASIDNAIHNALTPAPLNSHKTRSTSVTAAVATASRKRKATSDGSDSDDDSDDDTPLVPRAPAAAAAAANGNGHTASAATSTDGAPATSASSSSSSQPADGIIVKKQNPHGYAAAHALALGINDTIDIDGITSTLVGDAPTTVATDDEIAVAEESLAAEIQRLEREMRYTAIPVVQDPRAIEREIKKLEREIEKEQKMGHKLASELFCICRKPYQEGAAMIQCDACDEWYHLTCLNMTRTEANCIDHYVCANCDKLRAAGATAMLPANKRKKMKTVYKSETIMKEELKTLDKTTLDSEMENIEKMIMEMTDAQQAAKSLAAENDARADEEVKRLMALATQAKLDEKAARDAEVIAAAAAAAATEEQSSSDDDEPVVAAVPVVDDEATSDDNNDDDDGDDDDDHHTTKSHRGGATAARVIDDDDEERDQDLVDELRAAVDLWGLDLAEVAQQSSFIGGTSSLTTYLNKKTTIKSLREKQHSVRQWLQRKYAQPGNSAPPDTVAWGRGTKPLPILPPTPVKKSKKTTTSSSTSSKSTSSKTGKSKTSDKSDKSDKKSIKKKSSSSTAAATTTTSSKSKSSKSSSSAAVSNKDSSKSSKKKNKTADTDSKSEATIKKKKSSTPKAGNGNTSVAVTVVAKTKIPKSKKSDEVDAVPVVSSSSKKKSVAPSTPTTPSSLAKKGLRRDDSDQNGDRCTVCGDGGKLLCCDGCPAVFHIQCLVPPLTSTPRGSWYCSKCKAERVTKK